MSWAVEEWKDGLPGKALQKIQEIESQLDKLKKERQQKQFQLETLEAALQKQKQKMEVEKNEVTALKRENQSLVESCDNLEKTRQKVTHELQVKEQQLNYLEGQLAASKKQIEKLEQEIKRNKVELDRSQQSFAAGDQQSYGTPQKSFATPVTPSQKLHDSKLEEIQEKYYKEVEERQKLEAELKVMQIKKIIVKFQLLNQSSVSHKDIARQQTQSSIFPWQQDQTPSRQSHSFLETPLKRGIGASSFLWDHEETPYKRNSRSTMHDNAGSSQQSEQLKAMNQDLKAKVSEMELCLQAQDKDMKNHVNKLHEIQSNFEKAKMELAEKDKNLNKCRDELTRVTGQYEQTTSKCAALEQKLKQLSEELNCQRHNADSSRLALEQKMKDHEKEHQKELVHQQNSLRSLDQEFHQMKSKMSQELQLAKSDYNALQAEMDKIVQQKHHLEKCIEDLKQKLCRTEQILQASQTKENEMRKTFEGIQKEKNSLSCQFEQSSRRLTQVEEELKSAKQNLKQSHSLMEDFKAKTLAQSEELKCLQVKMENQDQSSALELENMKKVVSDVEKIKEMAQNQIKKQEQDLEQMKSKQTVMEKEQQALQIALDSKQNECTELKKENDFLSKWKTEKEDLVNSVETEREHMLNKIGDLEKNIEMIQNVSCGLTEKVNSLKSEKEDLTEQTDSLKGELLKKCMELEEKSKLYEELQKSSERDNLKYTKDLENAKLQIAELQAKASNLEMKLQLETCRADKMEQSYNEFILQYESACNLAKSKESVIDLKEEEILHLKNTISQALSQHEEQLEKLSTESLNFEKSQQEAAFLKDQVSSLESSLKLQKNLNVELQSKCEELSKVKASSSVSLQEQLEDENAQLKAGLQTLEEEIEQVTVRSRSLEDSHNILCQEKDSLLKEISRLNGLVGEKEDASAEMIKSYKNELGVANELCAQLKSSLEDLQGKYTSVMELNSTLEISLREESYKKMSQDKELVELQKKYRDESEERASKLKGYEDKQMQLFQEKEALQMITQEKETLKQQVSTHQSELESLKKISDRLKEKEVHLNKINVQLEMLQMDLEDNQKNCVCEGSEFEQLKNSLGILEAKLKENELQKSSLQKKLHSAREELAEKEREALLTKAVLEDAHKSSNSMNESYIALAAKVEMLQATNEKAQFSLDEEVKRYTVLENSYSNLVAEMTELKTKLAESQHHCQISSECQYDSLSNLSKQQCFIDQLQAEKALLTQETIHKNLKADTSELQTCGPDDGPLYRTQNDLCPLESELLKKSDELKMLSQTYEESLKTLKEQMDRQKEVSKEEIEELKAALSRVQHELDQLQQHHLDEVKVWQQKLVDLNAEMETRLAEEKQNCEFLSSELETARLQMQCLDLSSRSLLCSENDEEFHQNYTSKCDFTLFKCQNSIEMTEASLEDAILQAESAKAELEILAPEKKELTKSIECKVQEINDLKAVKEKLEKELLCKNEQVVQLQISSSAASERLEVLEKEVKVAKTNQENAAQTCESKVKEISNELQLSKDEVMSMQSKENDLNSQLSCFKNENIMLSQKLQDAEKTLADVKSLNQVLSQDCEAKQLKLIESTEVNGQLQQEVVDLQVLKQTAEEKLTSLEVEKEELEKEKVCLQTIVTEWEQRSQIMSTKAEVMQNTINSLEDDLKQHKHNLESVKILSIKCFTNVTILKKVLLTSNISVLIFERSNISQLSKDLTLKIVSMLQENCVKLQNEINDRLKKAERMQKDFELERNSLSVELQSSRQEVESYKLSLEISASEKEELKKNLALSQDNIALYEQKIKEMEGAYQEKLALAQERERVLVITKESIVSKTGKILSCHTNDKVQVWCCLTLHSGESYDKILYNTSHPESPCLHGKFAFYAFKEILISAKMQHLMTFHVLQYEGEKQALKRELTAAEEKNIDCLTEINDLKSSKEELNLALKESEIKLEQCTKIKGDLNSTIMRLTKEKDSALNKLQLWMKSCKQLEQEKEALLKENQQQELLAKRNASQEEVGALQSEIQELKEALDEKSKEADESMEKYCNIMISLHKLEEANEILENKLALMSSQVLPLKGAEEETDPAKAQEHLSSSKRVCGQVNPQTAQRTEEEDDEFRLEGLPEVVRKGFADIPSGEMSPYIIRRTTVQRCSPRLAAKRSPTLQTAQKGLENAVPGQKPTAEGSKNQKVRVNMLHMPLYKQGN
ncbi:CENPF protein, partial [Atractosteus spatula]|nr:CENPF protein [Atractosteus spatula]